ncbi:MAG: DUF2953 domain-containing protein [Eubacteriales bacterium]|nr:DUF2953 domain-containing protein [Clostridiales bacterium]MDY3760315.1 DUF2953 domain-containing protein [Eubacteriales bacterium]
MGIFLKILGIFGIVIACAVGLVILAVAALLPAKIKVRIGYIEEEFILSFKLLFFVFTVSPENKKKKKKKAKKKEKEKKERPAKKEKDNFFRSHTSDFGVFDYIELIGIVIEKFVAKIYFDKLEAEIRVAGDDAAQTALNFGRLNAAIYPIAGLINGHKRIKNLHIGITPDFTTTKSVYNAEAIAYIRIFDVLAAVIAIIKYLL